VRTLGIAARFPQGPPLPQEIPALVELDLEAAEALVLGVGERRLLAQPVLLPDQLLDVCEHLPLGLALRRRFVHDARLRSGGSRRFDLRGRGKIPLDRRARARARRAHDAWAPRRYAPCWSREGCVHSATAS
jgi:hypothetical protein